MKNLTALLFLMSLCCLTLVFSAPIALDYKTKCCSKMTTAKIPLKNIITYQWTNSNCFITAIVFKTKAKREICVDPTAPWVHHHMKAVDQELYESNGF